MALDKRVDGLIRLIHGIRRISLSFSYLGFEQANEDEKDLMRDLKEAFEEVEYFEKENYGKSARDYKALYEDLKKAIESVIEKDLDRIEGDFNEERKREMESEYRYYKETELWLESLSHEEFISKLNDDQKEAYAEGYSRISVWEKEF